METIDDSLVLLRQFDSRNYDTWKIIQGIGGASPNRYVAARSHQPSLRSKTVQTNMKTTRHSVVMSTFNFSMILFYQTNDKIEKPVVT